MVAGLLVLLTAYLSAPPAARYSDSSDAPVTRSKPTRAVAPLPPPARKAERCSFYADLEREESSKPRTKNDAAKLVFINDMESLHFDSAYGWFEADMRASNLEDFSRPLINREIADIETERKKWAEGSISDGEYHTRLREIMALADSRIISKIKPSARVEYLEFRNDMHNHLCFRCRRKIKGGTRFLKPHECYGPALVESE